MVTVSVIIVNYNGEHLIAECLQALLNQTYRNFEVIVVDNASTDNSAELIAQRFPWVTLIRLAKNKGFTGGNIEGLKCTRGNYIALLNNDTRVCITWLESLIKTIESDRAIGICSSKIIIDGTNKIDSTGNMFTTAGSGLKRGELEEDFGQYNEEKSVYGACAAAVLYRREMLDEIGFLDDDLFLNYEDTDLDFRALLAGWKSVFVPDAVVYHKVSATLGKMSDLTVYYFSRNSLLVWIKNMPIGLMVRYFHHRILYEIATFGYFCILNKKWKPYFTGKLSAISLIPKTLKKRRLIQRNRKVTIGFLTSVLIPVHYTVGQRISKVLN